MRRGASVKGLEAQSKEKYKHLPVVCQAQQGGHWDKLIEDDVGTKGWPL